MDSRFDPNAAVVCPFNPLHVISVKRFQRHLVKCRSQHPHKDFVTCPFNATHMFLRSELKKHISQCPDKILLDNDVIQDEDPETGEMLRVKGKTDMPRASEIIVPSSEDWDDEIEENLASKEAERKEFMRFQGFNRDKQSDVHILRQPIITANSEYDYDTDNAVDVSLAKHLNVTSVETNENREIVTLNPIYKSENDSSGNIHEAINVGCKPKTDSANGISSKGYKNELKNDINGSVSITANSCRSDEKQGRYNGFDDIDRLSVTSDSSCSSSVYEPLKRVSNKSILNPNYTGHLNDSSCQSTTAASNISDNWSAGKGIKSEGVYSRNDVRGISRGSLWGAPRTFSPVKSKENTVGRMGYNSGISFDADTPLKGLGRGSLKQIALSFHKS